jgi:von Willebrand factor type A domain
MLVSALCNLAALILLGLLAAASEDSWRGVKLLVTVGDGDLAAIDDSPLDQAVKLEVAADPAPALGPIRLFDDVAVATTDFAAIEPGSDNVSQAAGFDGLALGGTSQADGTTAHVATEFFGIGGYGQSFVYVVDASDSMNEASKFHRARYELLQSIEQLAGDQRYFVIFYNNGAYPMDADKPVLATQEQIALTARWINGAQADGGTNPLPALMLALSLRPDAIYFLSDGQFDPSTINQLRFRNRPSRRLHLQQIPIHTIAFVDRATEGLMRAIARNSGGEYRFVE